MRSTAYAGLRDWVPFPWSASVVGRWTFADGTFADEKTDSVTTNGDARTVFFIVKPGGFVKGKYALHVLTDGKEVRTMNVTVKRSSAGQRGAGREWWCMESVLLRRCLTRLGPLITDPFMHEIQ